MNKKTKPIAIGLAIAAATAALAGSANAATITSALDPNGSTYIYISGEIMPDDDTSFQDVMARIGAKGAAVVLSGPGGNLLAGLQIGKLIHEKGWKTWVLDNQICVSVCANIWLAGVPRAAVTTSHVGFHAAYRKDGQESGVGNALVGSYLTRIGLSYAAIVYLTRSSPKEMTYLTAKTAAELGIEVILEKPLSTPKQPPMSSRLLAPKQPPMSSNFERYVTNPHTLGDNDPSQPHRGDQLAAPVHIPQNEAEGLHIDGNGGYVIPAYIVAEMCNAAEYQHAMKKWQQMYEPGGLTVGGDGTVTISFHALFIKYFNDCDS